LDGGRLQFLSVRSLFEFFSASARLKKGSKKSDDDFTSDVSQTIAALYIPVMDKLISQI